MKLRLFSALVLLLIILPLAGGVSAQNFAVDAGVGLLYDFESQQVLFHQNADEEWIPASLVKVMTMYVAFDRIAIENLSFDSEITVSEKAWRMGGSQMFLEVGDRVTLDQLLYGIAVVSGNDACVAIAEALAGTEELFVQWMNNKSEELGLDLHFVDVHGLSENNSINARDFAILVKNYLEDYPEALAYHSALSFGYQPRSSSTPIFQSNRNGLLRTYDGTDGLKTGYLGKAGYNLVVTAQREDRRLIAIVLGADSESKREQEVIKLLDYGFRSFETVSANQLLPSDSERIYKGRSDYVALTTNDASVTVLRGNSNRLSAEINVDRVEAPIEAGEEIGTLTIYYDGEVEKEIPLFAAETVERGSWFTVLVDSFVLFFKKIFSQG